MARRRRIYLQEEVDAMLALTKDHSLDEASKIMEQQFHRKYSPSQLSVQVRQAQGLLPTKDQPVARVPRLNGVTTPRPGLLPDLYLSKLQLLPSVVTGEDVKENPVTDFLINQLGPVDGLEVSSISSSSIPDTPRPEDLSSMLLHTVKDVANSIPRLAVNSWKDKVMTSMWKKMNPSNEDSSSIDLIAEVKRQIDNFFNEQKSQPKKTDIPEVIRKYEASQKKDAGPSLPPADSGGLSSENRSPPEMPTKPSPDAQASFPPTIPPQPKITAGAADEENNKSTETNAPLVPTIAPLEPGPNAVVVGSDSKTPELPSDTKLKSDYTLKPDANAGVITLVPSTVIQATQPPPAVPAYPKADESQIPNGTENPSTANPTIQPRTQDTISPVQPTIIESPSISAPNPNVVSGVKQDPQPIGSFIQTGVIPNHNGSLLRKAMWITAGVGMLGLAIYIFNPHVGDWIFSHFIRFIQVAQQQFQRVEVPDQSRVASPSEAPTLYSVPPVSSRASLKAAGYSRVNNPTDSACF